MIQVTYCRSEILQRGPDSAALLHLTLTVLLPQLPGATDKIFPMLLPRVFSSKKTTSFSLKGILASVANNIHFPLTLLHEEFFTIWENAHDNMS